MSISQIARDFITLAIQSGGWMEMDRLYLENRVIAMIGEDSLEKAEIRRVSNSAVELVDQLLIQAEKNKVITSLQAEKEILEAQLMDLMTPPPSVVNAYFAQYYSKDPIQATDYFYKLSKENDYIKTREIAQNIIFPAETEYGELEITINLSKPEKDPKQIAEERQAVKVDYPECMLCMENEGYKGRLNYPARANHRIIRMNLDGESWGFQYSPYAYYDEHCIILSEEHRPMKITIVKWPLSVIRLQGENQNDLIEASTMILEKWQSYSDESLQIVAHTEDGIPHHTITPIARRKENLFEIDLVLRDNNVSEEFPDGIFHPHPDVQHIKKENIGLIEVMGLAVLPPRLQTELNEVENYLLEKENNIADYHIVWADQLKADNQITRENVTQVVQKAVGAVFARVLEDAGVFKRDVEGQEGFMRFIKTL